MTDEPGSVEQRLGDVEQRIERLERVVKDLIDAMVRRGVGPPAQAAPEPRRRAVAPPPPPPPPGTPRPLSTEAPRPSARRRYSQESLQRAFQGKGSPYWLSRLGIGLFLLGVAFLFKYAVDQGWLTPRIRVAMGLVLGATLVGIGLRVRRERRAFAAIALGGATATFYITGFAAFQLFHLASYPVALGFMVAVTIYTMWAAVLVDEPVLSVLAALGGLGTPFLLDTPAGSVARLAAYESVVLVGTAAIYLKKGWESLLWTTVVGGWAVVLAALLNLAPAVDRPPADNWLLQQLVLVAVAAFWAVPLARERLAAMNPARSGLSAGAAVDYGPRLLTLSTPILAFYASQEIWRFGETFGAAVAAGGALVWGMVWWRLRREEGDAVVASVHAVAAAALLAIALQHLFSNHTLLFTVAVEAAGLHMVARATGERPIRLAAHALALVVGVAIVDGLTDGHSEGVPALNVRAGMHIAALALGLLSARTLEDRRQAGLYGLAVHVLFLGWLWQELSPLPAGHAWVTTAWGVYGSALLIGGLRLDRAGLRATALATFGAVVVKLFLVDLAELEAIWRILLFLGFGAAFLALSYYFPSLWRIREVAPADEESGER